ncbi:MAG TPA: S-layer homology domain-containing protein [Negativicutes bacterium]|nr:S-layer homology domain-containing protein [Negativicutes bacterium]
MPVSGYTVQYNTAADGSGTVVTDLKAAAALTYLIWTPNTYTVTFNPEDGAVSPATKNVTYDSVYGTLPTAVRAGFTFGGWWTGDDGTGTQVRDTTAVRITADQTLYAKWTINPHTVTFDSHGGYGVEDVTVSHNQPLGASFPAAPVLAGHRFDGWYLDTGGTGAEFTANTPVTADITVYAKWTAKTPVSINEAAQTATFDGTAKAFTVSGMPGGEYNISYKRGEDSVIPVNAGSYDVVITRGEDDTYAAYSRTIANGLVITPPTISLQEIRGVTPPATGALPVAAITETMQFTGTVSWSPSDSRFAGSRAYTATVRLTPTGNYTLTGVGENFFAVVGATSVTNPAGSGVIAAAFPATAAEPSGGGDTVPVTKYSASVNTVSGSGATLPVTVNKDTRTASVDAGTQNLASGETAVTVPSIPDVDAYSVGIPVPELSTASKQGTLTFKTDTGSVTVPSNMLTGVSGSKAVISVGKGNKDSLPYNVKAAIGDKPLIRLTLSIDRKQTNWNNPDARVIISIPYTPTAEELLHPESIVVWYIDGSGNVVTIPNGHYDPATGMVTFNITHFSDYAVAYNQVSFNDVVTGAWYTKAVSFIAAREITSGTGDGNYSPNARLTRGEFIVLMMRAYGIVPNTNPANNFSDAGNTYYTGYLAAAKRLGITAGAGNNMYAPGKEITRQEMFTLLYNTLKVIGHLPQGDSGKSLFDFNDAGQIDTWAKDAMMVLVETGTVGGSAGRLTPTGTTTRAEMAQVLYNLLEK